jgi:hypothetical protein
MRKNLLPVFFIIKERPLPSDKAEVLSLLSAVFIFLSLCFIYRNLNSNLVGIDKTSKRYTYQK